MRSLSWAILSFGAASAFQGGPLLSLRQQQVCSGSTTARHVDTAALGDIAGGALEDVETARTAFFVWFFGASGAAGISRSAFPRMYNNVKLINSLKDQGPSLGGETLGISPLIGYPTDLCTSDVEQVVNNPLSVEQMVDKYPVDNNLWSKNGYLTFQAFEQANAKSNPLAVRAVMESMAQAGGEVVEPGKAQEKLDTYAGNVEALKQDLLKNKLVGYSSIVTLLFLLGLADIVAAGHFYHGWFPEWPGAENFPFTIFDGDKSLFAIPKYWI